MAVVAGWIGRIAETESGLSEAEAEIHGTAITTETETPDLSAAINIIARIEIVRATDLESDHVTSLMKDPEIDELCHRDHKTDSARMATKSRSAITVVDIDSFKKKKIY